MQHFHSKEERGKNMKRFISFLLVIVMLSTLAVGAFADSSVVRDGNALYAETGEISMSELYATFKSYFDDAALNSLANANTKSAKKLTLVSPTYTNVIDEASLKFVLDNSVDVTNSDGTVTLAPGNHTVKVSFNYHSDYSYKVLTKTFTGSYDGTVNGGAKNITFSIREKTVINTAKSTVSYVYGTENAAQLIMDTVKPTVAVANSGAPVDDALVTIVENVSNLNAGTHTITLRYAGKDNGNYTGLQAATKEITVNVSKIPTSIKVDGSLITYDGAEHMPTVAATPEGIPYTMITVGLTGDAVGFASIYMSEGNALYKALIFLRDSGDALTRLANFLGYDISGFVFGSEGLSLTQLRGLVSGLVEISDLLKYAGIDLDGTQIDAILKALDGIGDFIEKYNIEAKFYIGNMPKNSGLYVCYAVINEANYESSTDFATITIAPDFNVSMKWEQSTGDYSFYPNNVKSFNFKAFVTSDGTTPLDAQISYKITGLGSDGKYFTGDLENLPTLPGTYTETASCTLNYASSASRKFTINKQPTSVKFVGADGQYTDTAALDVQYDGEAKGLSAVVLDKDGNVLEGAEVTYSYTGTTKTGVKYSSSAAPFDSGDYTVKASYAGDNYNAASSASGTVAIHKAPASIAFANTTSKLLKKIDYSKISYTYEGMSAEEAAQIAATLGCKSKIHLLIGTHNYTYSIPSEIAAKYDVTVTGKHTVKLFG